MDAESIAARSGPWPHIIQLVKWETTDFTIRWTTGGFLVWSSETWLARDPTYGTLGNLPTFSDGIDNQATRVNLTVYPETYAALAAMADRKHQNTLVRVWEADVDPVTGLLIGTPDPLFRGLIDFGRLVLAEQQELVLECGTEEGRLSEANEDRRLSSPHHRSIWPGELGLNFVTGLGRKIYWRMEAPSVVSGGGGYVGGGGGQVQQAF